MGQFVIVFRQLTPGRIVFANSLGVARFLIVVTTARRNSVECLGDTPPTTRHDQRVLHNVAALEIYVFSALVLFLAIPRGALEHRDLGAVGIAHGETSQKVSSHDGRLSALCSSHS